MIWIILIIIALIGFVGYRQVRLVKIEMNIAKAKRDKTFRKVWAQIPLYEASMPMKMAFNEVFNKPGYRKNFDTHFSLFIKHALNADERLDSRIVQMYSNQLMENLPAISGMSLGMDADTTTNKGFPNESGAFLSAVLYALIVTQDKGSNIKQKLMLGKNNQAGNDMYLQQRTDKEYFEFMNNKYPNFCQLVSIIEPRKSVQIQIVAGYLLTE